MRLHAGTLGLAAAVAAVAAIAVLPACDPCAGVSICGEPRVDVEGRLRVLFTGEPADSTRVIVEPLVESVFDSTEVWTDPEGRFRIVGPAPTEESVPVRLIFVPQAWPHLAYAVEVDLPISRVEGARRYIGEWAVGPYAADPHIRTRGQLRYEYAGGSPGGVEVAFERTSGPVLTPERPTTQSNWPGDFTLVAAAASAGTVTGRLVITPPPPHARQVIEDVEIPVFTAAPLTHQLGEWTVDYTLRYAGELRWGDGSGPVEGATVIFARTGGVEVEPDPHTMTSGGDGRFWFEVIAQDLGTVEGELTAALPDGREVELGAVELETFVGPPRLLGVWWFDPPADDPGEDPPEDEDASGG